MKKLLLAITIASCFVSTSVGAANEGEECGGASFSAATRDELKAQANVLADMRRTSAEHDSLAGDMLGAPRVDIKALSCVDKYAKMKIIVSFPWPSIDMLFEKLYAMACNVVDDKVNEMTSKIATNTKLPYGLGSLGLGTGMGKGPGFIDTKTPNKDISGRVLDGLFN